MLASVALLILAPSVLDVKPTVCPIMGSPANMAGAKVDFAGARYAFCCGGCPEAFAKNPAQHLKNPRLRGKVAGTSLFDPVTGMRTEPTKFMSEYQGTRFFFASAANKKTFDAAPTKFGTLPARVVLTCPVSGDKHETYAETLQYVDHAGVRYFFCCSGCPTKFKAEPAKYAAKAKPVAPMAIMVKADQTAKATGGSCCESAGVAKTGGKSCCGGN